eukprot:CAMPEP_0170479316 /NCGR_PEP_ID=MMETSP0208-20121228/594_1 /TAXON_ID=197538 /ORGANISM="Strombidium inclinatum, Strain S3" /LENGTH=334 /DNA_ID=CAMNT_0010751687 /DNA_START=186 /DNA_END=1191 /DNA_ORIENTATION=+
MEMLRRLLNLVSTPVAIVSFSLDVVYVLKVLFYNQGVHTACVLLIITRLVIAIFAGQRYYWRYVRNYKPDQAGLKHDHPATDAQLIEMGEKVYASNHFMLMLGSFRILSSNEFGNVLLVGYLNEAMTSVFPMFVLQMMNNTKIEELTSIQRATLGVKAVWVLLFLPEIVFMLYEIFRKRNLQHVGILAYAKPSEEERRFKYSGRALVTAIFTVSLFALVTTSGIIAAPPDIAGRASASRALCARAVRTPYALTAIRTPLPATSVTLATSSTVKASAPLATWARGSRDASSAAARTILAAKWPVQSVPRVTDSRTENVSLAETPATVPSARPRCA